jgi:rhodanese-related sulfurtransferase
MPFIQNISRTDCREGNHANINPERDVLIQISDPPAMPPQPHYRFALVHQFWFDDTEADTGPHGEVGITVAQANQIADILSHALAEGRNVIVHCHAGLCRSGGVAQAGEAMGFAPGGRRQVPNILVKHRIMRALGLLPNHNDPKAFSRLRTLLLNRSGLEKRSSVQQKKSASANNC